MTNLTEAAISSKKFVAPDIKYDDHNSLVIVAGKKGRHTWRIKTRSGSDRIGYYPAMSLKEARAIAEERANRIDRGIPVTATPAAPNAGMTIADLLDKYEQARRYDGLATLAKSKPGKIAYATSGIGTTPHLAAALWSQRAGVELLHVPYANTNAALKDVLSGEVPVLFTFLGTVEGFLRSDQLKALAVTSAKRDPGWARNATSSAVDGRPSTSLRCG